MNITNVKTKYKDEVVPVLVEEFGFKNRMAVPKIDKVTINVGIGRINKESDKINEIVESITTIAGQKPVKTRAKKAIAGFKSREGMEIGVKVTLRQKKMWDFLDKLINSALPRTRDFQGIKLSSVGKDGNLNLGIKDHVIFPEIVPEKVRYSFGLQIIVTSTAENKEEGTRLFELIGIPFNKN